MVDAARRFTAAVVAPTRSVRATHAAPTRLLIVFTAERHMSSGRSMAATSAIPAAARGPSPIAFSTMSVVTSELPGTPAPANAAIVAIRTIVIIAPGRQRKPVQMRDEDRGRPPCRRPIRSC